MKDRVRGILIQNGSIALMHRIKKINNEVLDYYVVPGGGVENGESLEEALKREMLEEVGIGIRIYNSKDLYTLNTDTELQHFMLIEQTSGLFGTGNGEEFSRNDRGIYHMEMILLNDLLNGEISLLPDEFRIFLIDLLSNFDNIDTLNSRDLLMD